MWLEEQGQPSTHPQSQFVGMGEWSAVQSGDLAQGCSWSAGSEDEFLPYYHPYTYNVGLFVGFWFGWFFSTHHQCKCTAFFITWNLWQMLDPNVNAKINNNENISSSTGFGGSARTPWWSLPCTASLGQKQRPQFCIFIGRWCWQTAHVLLLSCSCLHLGLRRAGEEVEVSTGSQSSLRRGAQFCPHDDPYYLGQALVCFWMTTWNAQTSQELKIYSCLGSSRNQTQILFAWFSAGCGSGFG